jgi:cystathionine beta-synthase
VYSRTNTRSARSADPTRRRRDRGRRSAIPVSDRPNSLTPAAVDSLEDLVGHTPMLRVEALDARLNCNLFLKLELCNPGGSVKDRTALGLIRYGEERGLLKEGGIIVEPTSGNTGVGLAVIAARRGYRCLFTVRDKVSTEKIALLEAYGAQVVVCPSDVPNEHPNSYCSVAARLAASIDGAYMPNQYENHANQRVHYETTGPEIWKQTSGAVTHFVASAGTGGTISGAGAYLKTASPTLRVVCIDPAGSVFSGDPPHPYLVEGAGSDFIPANFDRDTVDEVRVVSDAEAIGMCHQLVAAIGLLTGGSGGMVVAGALQVAEDCKPDDNVVALIPDSGRGYLSKVYSNAWLAAHGITASARVSNDYTPTICGHTRHMSQWERRDRLVD